MVQIGRRALLNYFKMIIENRFYANTICFSKNEVSRTPMWTRDFLEPIITYKSLTGDYSIQCNGNGTISIITYKSLTGEYSYIHNVPSTLNIITHNSLVEII